MSQRRFKQYNKPRQPAPEELDDEFEKWVDSFEEDELENLNIQDELPRDGSKEKIQISCNGAYKQYEKFRQKRRREQKDDYRIVVDSEQDAYRKDPTNLRQALRRSKLTIVERNIIDCIYDYQCIKKDIEGKDNTGLLSISKIADEISSNRTNVRVALKNLQQRWIVFKIHSKKVYGNTLYMYKLNKHFEDWKGNNEKYQDWLNEERRKQPGRMKRIAQKKAQRKRKQSKSLSKR